MTSDTLLVTVAVAVAALWLGVRMWKRAKAKYKSGPCCGEGCGCSGPVLFGPKKKRKR